MLSKDWLACLVSFLFSSMVVPFSGRLISSGERIATNIYLLSKSSRKKHILSLLVPGKGVHSGGRGIMAGLILRQIVAAHVGQQFIAAFRLGSAYPVPVIKLF